MSSQILIASKPPVLPLDPLDVLNLTAEKSIGIDACRRIPHFLATSPYHSLRKAVVIFPADRLTIEAQNSLLKILEEPPLFADLFLVTLNPGSLIPTIQSRCVIIQNQPLNNDDQPRAINKLLSSLSAPLTPSQALMAASATKIDRITLLSEISHSLESLSQSLLSLPSFSHIHQSRLMLATYLSLKQNANISLSLSHLFLHWNLPH